MIDTNIALSAILSPSGRTADVLKLAIREVNTGWYIGLTTEFVKSYSAAATTTADYLVNIIVAEPDFLSITLAYQRSAELALPALAYIRNQVVVSDGFGQGQILSDSKKSAFFLQGPSRVKVRVKNCFWRNRVSICGQLKSPFGGLPLRHFFHD